MEDPVLGGQHRGLLGRLPGLARRQPEADRPEAGVQFGHRSVRQQDRPVPVQVRPGVLLQEGPGRRADVVADHWRQRGVDVPNQHRDAGLPVRQGLRRQPAGLLAGADGDVLRERPNDGSGRAQCEDGEPQHPRRGLGDEIRRCVLLCAGGRVLCVCVCVCVSSTAGWAWATVACATVVGFTAAACCGGLARHVRAAQQHAVRRL